MTEYSGENRGVLFKNEKKKEPTHADYNGSINVNGKEFWLDAWIKQSKKDGRKFMSLSVKAKTEAAAKKPTPAKAEPDDEIPF